MLCSTYIIGGTIIWKGTYFNVDKTSFLSPVLNYVVETTYVTPPNFPAIRYVKPAINYEH